MPEYQWLLKLPIEYQQRIESAQTAIKPILSTNLIPHLTDHSMGHSNRIIDVLGHILEANLKEEDDLSLHPKEIEILVIAALLHDISLQLPKAYGITTDMGSISIADAKKMRSIHGEVSGAILREIADGKDNYGLGFNQEESRKIFPIVAKLCERHQSSTTYDPEEISALGSKKIRVGVLIALLRLADQLDCDSRRVRMDFLKQCSVPVSSIYHWLMCHYVDAVIIEEGDVGIFASYPKSMTGPIITLLTGSLHRKILDEYRPARSVFWKNNIRIQLPEGIDSTGEDFTYAKQVLPEEIVQAMQPDLIGLEPTAIQASKSISNSQRQGGKELNFMSHWGFIGNPFLDRPVYYGSDLFVETSVISETISETKQHLLGATGDLRLIVGGRGMGKTTLFKTIEKRFGEDYSVHVIDVAAQVVNIRSAIDLHRLVEASIRTTLKPDEQDVRPERILELARFGKKKVICIDSLDRLPEDRLATVQEFFKTWQQFLSELRSVSVVFIAFAEAWGSALGGKEFSYLGMKNQRTLEPFSTAQLRLMLEKRLRSSGRTYSDIFDEDCIVPLHKLSSGNPRSLLEHAEAICRLGARKGIKRVTREFIRESYQERFDDAIRDLVLNLARSSESLKKGFTSLYVFYLEMERRNLNLDEGWGYLLAMLKGSLLRDKVSVQFYTPLKFVGYFTEKEVSGNRVVHYKVHDFINEVFSRLKKDGISPEDFVSYYSANSIRPVEEDDSVLVDVKSPLLTGEDVKHQEKARQLFLELRKTGRPPFQVITLAWDCIEEMMIAILMRHSDFNLQNFEKLKGDALYVDRMGVSKLRSGAGIIFSEAANTLVTEFLSFLKKNGIWMTSYNGMKWIRDTRNNVVRGRAQHLAQYGDKDKDLCLAHLEPVYKELNHIYG